MILVDTSVWVDHFRAGDRKLMELLDGRQVLAHPFVIGEIALGILARRRQVLDALSELPQANVATESEILQLIDHLFLAGIGVGHVDVHLLAACRLTPGSRLWTRDKRLHMVAQQAGLAAGA